MAFPLYLESLKVAPLVGAWIEILTALVSELVSLVAPLVGAWIEIMQCVAVGNLQKVAPLVGAWIEILSDMDICVYVTRRSPRGSVD